MPRVLSAPLPTSVFSSMSVLSLRQRASSPAAANARLNSTASSPTRSMITASAHEDSTPSTIFSHELQPRGEHLVADLPLAQRGVDAGRARRLARPHVVVADDAPAPDAVL